MTAADVTHIVFWAILALTGLGIVGAVGAMFSMGRSSYRKD
ncbi:hypothetical protein [Microbacterium gorillae]